jgi:hypothetical protein
MRVYFPLYTIYIVDISSFKLKMLKITNKLYEKSKFQILVRVTLFCFVFNFPICSYPTILHDPYLRENKLIQSLN